MSRAIEMDGTEAPWKGRFVEGLKALWTGFVAYRQHQVLVRALEGLSDRQLADCFGIRREQIGVKAAQIATEALGK